MTVTQQATEINNLVDESRVHHRVYTDPEIFDLEMARIFEHTWIYAAHESEVPAPGDYVRSRVGREDVIIVRTDSGELVGLRNRCLHRGAEIVRATKGHLATFDCPYHGWSYSRDGQLVGVPLVKGYGADFDLDGEQRNLTVAKRIASYRGFIFVSLSGEVPDLGDFLAPIREMLDNMVDRAPDGELVCEGGEFRQIYSGNWKLHVENTLDSLHAPFLHRSSWNTVAELERQSNAEPSSDQMVQMIKANNIPLPQLDAVGLRALPHGHTTYGQGNFYKGSKIAMQRAEPYFVAYKEALTARQGLERAEEILSLDRFNTLVYPNLVINVRFQHMRQFQPVSVDRSIVRAFCFRMAGAPAEMHQVAVRFLTSMNSPTSMISQDDLEIFASIQRAIGAGAPWIDFSRGVGEENADGDITTAAGTAELAMRNQFKAWLGYMAAA